MSWCSGGGFGVWGGKALVAKCRLITEKRVVAPAAGLFGNASSLSRLSN